MSDDFEGQHSTAFSKSIIMLKCTIYPPKWLSDIALCGIHGSTDVFHAELPRQDSRLLEIDSWDKVEKLCLYEQMVNFDIPQHVLNHQHERL